MSDANKETASGQEQDESKVGSLKGQTVMVTRPRGQSDEMVALLESLGATVIHCPTIKTVEPDDWSRLDATIEKIESYDWIVFTSSNGVKFFISRLIERRDEGISSMARPVICAIGPATAKALSQKGIRVDIIAGDSKAEGALKAIIEFAGGEEKLRGVKFLIPRARVARDFLPDNLEKLGAHVEAVEAYRMVRPDADGESIIRLFEEGRVNVITFTSSSTVSNFAEIVGMKNLSSLLQNSLVACIGPVTAATAAEYGIDKIAQPEAYTSVALVEAIVRSIEKGDG